MSLATHPNSTKHRQLNSEIFLRSVVKKQALRLSIGIERIDDLIVDLEQVLEPV